MCSDNVSVNMLIHRFRKQVDEENGARYQVPLK